MALSINSTFTGGTISTLLESFGEGRFNDYQLKSTPFSFSNGSFGKDEGMTAEFLENPFAASTSMSYAEGHHSDEGGGERAFSTAMSLDFSQGEPQIPLTVNIENFHKLSPYVRNCVIAYVVLFCIGAPGNLFVFISVGREIWRRQLIRSRIKVLIWHLATADLFVTFVVIPIEIFWRLTIQWYGGDALCKLVQFFRAFGLYLSSMVIICISLDRFFAIVFPLKVIGGMKRVRNMLCVAWASAFLFAAPQILVFSVRKHPFMLCSNSDYFLSLSKEIMYNLLSLVVMYFAPLLVIIVTYAMVLFTIARKSREHHQDCRPRSGSNQLRRSDNASNIARARRKTLWLSMVIVTVFVLCWTPYVTVTLWFMFDFETADKLVDSQMQEAFFVTAVSNSCVNPIIYGNYMKKYWRSLRNAACRSRNSSTSSSRIVSSSRNIHQNTLNHNVQHLHHNRSSSANLLHSHFHHHNPSSLQPHYRGFPGNCSYRCTHPSHSRNFSLMSGGPLRCQTQTIAAVNPSEVTISNISKGGVVQQHHRRNPFHHQLKDPKQNKAIVGEATGLEKGSSLSPIVAAIELTTNPFYSSSKSSSTSSSCFLFCQQQRRQQREFPAPVHV